MVRPEGFEPPTPKFVAWCSIQLSYGRARSGILQQHANFVNALKLAESEGFEPSMEF